MNARKNTMVAAALVMVLLLALSGCGQKPTQGKKVDKILMQASSMGGIGYGYSLGLSKVAAKVTPDVSFTVEATAGYIENAKRLSQDVGHIGVISQDDGYAVFKKQGDFASAKARLLTMFPVHTLDWHIIVPGDGPVKTIWDLKGRKVSVQPKGSFNERLSSNILAALDIECNKVYLTHSEAAEQMASKSLDAHIASGSSPAFAELAVRMPLKVISLSPDDISKIRQKLPYLNETDFKAEAYYKGTGTVKSVNVWAIVACREDLPEDLVYKLVKGVYENKDLMVEGHPSAKLMDPAQVTKLTVPLHPGAYKFFTEKGIAVPDSLKPPK
ncbi:MAG: TAXI family TRAP transporter solute-binding subunit [Firmicutes bacterium]|nr:TAXI family TRAP transporter solute-binding subunit [Bacillota bacterium]